jgi:hypothetical protein
VKSRTDVEVAVPFEPAYTDLPAWQRRAEALRAQIRTTLDLPPLSNRPPVRAVINQPIERDAYTIYHVSFTSVEGYDVTGSLYRPHGEGPFPAVLHPHGHWKDGRLQWNDDEKVAKELASGAERTEVAARVPLQAFNANLAMRGCVVFIYDMVAYGESSGVAHGDPVANTGAQTGMGLQIWNGLRALDFVGSLPYVDAERIGAAGASSGGLQSVIMAALDERILATAPVAMIAQAKQGGCVCETAPHLRVGTNNVEFAALIAPRPLGFASCNDWTADFSTNGLPQIRRIYDLYGAADRLEHAHVPFGHNFNVHSREFVYGFFNRHLQLNCNDSREQAFEPVPPKQLARLLH